MGAEEVDKFVLVEHAAATHGDGGEVAYFFVTKEFEYLIGFAAVCEQDAGHGAGTDS